MTLSYILVLMLHTAVHSEMCMSGQGPDKYARTQLHPDLTLLTSIAGTPSSPVYYTSARVSAANYKGIDIRITTPSGDTHTCNERAYVNTNILACYFFIRATLGETCNSSTNYTVYTSLIAWDGAAQESSATLGMGIHCDNSCVTETLCAGCGSCEEQCKYCSKFPSLLECSAVCGSVCKRSHGTTCNATEMSSCNQICDGMCDVCNMQEKTEKDVTSCYRNWTHTCNGDKCSYKTCSYTNHTPKDVCHSECRKKCYVRDRPDYCPYNGHYEPHSCYDQCTVFCKQPTLLISILLCVMGLVGVAGVAIILFKGLTKDETIMSYDM